MNKVKIEQEKLDVVEKKRSNLFNWKGQFTPEFVEYLLDCFASEDIIVADIFSGSGTVLLESARRNLQCFGYEINPSAYYMSKFYQYVNMALDERYDMIREVESVSNKILKSFLPDDLVYQEGDSYRECYCNLLKLAEMFVTEASELMRPFIINVLYMCEKDKKKRIVDSYTRNLEIMKSNLIFLPYSDKKIEANLSDARNISKNHLGEVDLIITSPPYINVFNYHQNYRALIECFGYNVLKVASSEFGSNRKNRSNRFKTVVQYTLDMGSTILEATKALKCNGRMIFVVGRESMVRKTPFYNSEIIKEVIKVIPNLVLESEETRCFKNRFGENITEDILIIKKINDEQITSYILDNFESIAYQQIKNALKYADATVKEDLLDIINGEKNIKVSPIYN